MEKAVGNATIYANSKTYRTKPGAKLMLGGYSRNALVGDQAVTSYSEMPVPASVTGEFTCTSTTDISEINDIVNGTIVFATDVGTKYTIRSAFCSKPCELSAGEGALSFEFMGPPGIQTK